MYEKLGLKEAKAAVEVMLEYATAKKLASYSVVVVDNAGVLTYFGRMDGAFPLTARMAINKALTAIDWARDTIDLQKLIMGEKYGEPGVMGAAKRDIAWFGDSRAAPIPGGVLIKSSDGSILGAVGTSGGTVEADEELARVGAKAAQEAK